MQSAAKKRQLLLRWVNFKLALVGHFYIGGDMQVHDIANRDVVSKDPGAENFAGGYAAHYCNVPTLVDPPIMACSMILSGLRVFDIRDPKNPKEIAYFVAPVKPRILNLTAPPSNYAMARPTFVPERKEIWYSDVYQGFFVVRLTNGVW